MDHKQFIEAYYVERKNTQSIKWDGMGDMFTHQELIPLWIADLDFKVSEAITDAFQDRVDHAVYGYTTVPESYYTTYKAWMKTHYNFAIETDWIRFSPGIVQALYHFMNAFTQVGDAAVILTPVYYPFHHAIQDTGRKLITVDLINQDNHFSIDFDAFEAAIIQEDVKVFIHCSPHNPTGRVWTEEEHRRLFDICQKHQVLIISDEIHQDFTYGNHRHIPSAVVADGQYRDLIVTANSASKTFNLAALTHSNLIISHEGLRQQYDEYIKGVVRSEPSLFGIIATQAAYKQGQDWLNGLKNLVTNNYRWAKERLNQALPQVTISPLEGTYLMFVNLNPILNGIDSVEFMEKRCGIAVDYGEWFGDNYTGYIRINLGTKTEIIEQAIEKIIEEALKL